MATYDRRHVVIQWGGTLPGGEIWSNSLRASSSGTGPAAPVPTDGEMADWLEGPLKGAIAAFHQRATTHVHANAKLTFAKANVVGTDGHYVQANTHEYVYPTPLPGGGTGSGPPNQVSWVVSLTTGFSRGPAHRGRFYLPLPAVILSATTGQLQASEAIDCAASAATFIIEAADTPGPDLTNPLRIVVMSAKVGAPATNVVTGVDVGRVLDTQRRRRTELLEDYQHAPVDQGAW